MSKLRFDPRKYAATVLEEMGIENDHRQYMEDPQSSDLLRIEHIEQAILGDFVDM